VVIAGNFFMNGNAAMTAHFGVQMLRSPAFYDDRKAVSTFFDPSNANRFHCTI
jgi:hypothetical protein